MEKHFTKLFFITAVLMLNVFNFNGQVFKSITSELSFDCLKENIDAAVEENWVTFTNNYSTRKKCVEGAIPNLSSNERIITFNVSNCESFTITGDGNKEERFLSVKINDGTAFETESWPNGCSTQTFSTENTGDITISISGVKGSVYLANVTFTPATIASPIITDFVIDGVSAIINQDAGTITAQLPYGTNLSALTPIITTAGGATEYTPVGAQDFTNSDATPIEYTVTDGTNSKTYKVSLTTAIPLKEVTEIIFSNSFYAFINGETVTAYYLEGTDKPTIQSFEASDGATVSLSADGTKVIVTGADNTTRELTLTLEPVTPFAATTPLTFDGSEGNWIKTGYSYDTEKGWRFAKAIEEETNKRISEGKTRLYFFVGNYNKLTFTSGSGGNRAIKVFINGVEQTSPTETGASGTSFSISLSGATSYMVEIRSNQTSGDGGVTALVAEPEVISSIEKSHISNVFYDGTTIQNPNFIRLSVYDISGRLIITSSKDIDMSHCQKGIYIIKSGLRAKKINVR